MLEHHSGFSVDLKPDFEQPFFWTDGGSSATEALTAAGSEAAAAVADKLLSCNVLEAFSGRTPEQSTTGVQNRHSQDFPSEGLKPYRETGGIDTLVVRLRGTWDRRQQDEAFRQLELARSTAEAAGQESVGFVAPSGDELELHVFGFSVPFEGRYAWRCTWQGSMIAFADRRESQAKTARPEVVVRFGSLMLMEFGHLYAWRMVVELLASFGFKVDARESTPSELHVCADLLTSCVRFVQEFIAEKYVGGGAKGRIEISHRKFVGFRCGARSALEMEVYDKLQELRDKPSAESAKKFEVMQRYRFAGEFPQHCTRVEFRMRRDKIVELGGINMEDLFRELPRVVAYCVGDWFRLTADEVDRKNGNQARSVPSALWMEVAAAFRAWVGRQSDEQREAVRAEVTVDALIRQVDGLAASIVARSVWGAGRLAEFFRGVAEQLEADVAGDADSCGPFVASCVDGLARRRERIKRRQQRLRSRLGEFDWFAGGDD